MSDSEPQSTLGAALAAIQASVSNEEKQTASKAPALVSAADAAAAKVVAAPVNSRRRNSSASAKVEAATHASAQKKGRPAVGSEEENETMDDVEVSASGSGDEAPQNEGSANPTKSDASSTGSGFPASLQVFIVEGNETVPQCASWNEGTHLLYASMGCGV
jgi:hypothetical protein